MKKFLSGVLCATLVFSLALSALAISGRMTIEVDPINIMVNGEVFVPKDVNGKEVPQFAYQGTTYAPLRALAEAYGLEVGYDAEKNMATVNGTDHQSTESSEFIFTPKNTDDTYRDFLAMWDMQLSTNGKWLFLVAKDTQDALNWWGEKGSDKAHDCLSCFADELTEQFDNDPPYIAVIDSGARENEMFYTPYTTVVFVNWWV